MIKNILIITTTFIIGFIVSYCVLKYLNLRPGFENGNLKGNFNPNINDSLVNNRIRKDVIGFLPFWLVSGAKEDYSKYITNLSVFSLVVDSDGHIKKYTNPTEGEPGYFSLINGKFDDAIKSAKAKNTKISLVVFSGDDEDINLILDNPLESASNLTSDIIPLAQKHGFNQINLDIEQVSDASESARVKYKDFVAKVREDTSKSSLGLTIDVTASSFVKTTNLVDPFAISDYVDKIIIMTYDYHFIGSKVTGAVAPLSGAGTISEYDVQTALVEAIRKIKPEKIILGIPLYGYEWETIGSTPRSATIPSTGLTISNKKAEKFLESCLTCQINFSEIDKEMNIIYKDTNTKLYHQIFYPEIRSMKSKLDLAERYKLGGVALWALGYEGDTILEPLYEWNR